MVTKPLEEARRAKIIGHSLNASVHLYGDEEMYNFLKTVENDLADLFIVSEVVLDRISDEMPSDVFKAEEDSSLAIKIDQAKGEKCERCWKYTLDVGQDHVHTTLCKRCASVLEG